MRQLILLAFCLFFLTACAANKFFQPADGPPSETVDISKIQNAVPTVEPKSLYGNAPHYCVLDHCYDVLESSKGYSEKGIASWYGTKFNHQLTSNGENYDMLKMTAAHKTLPLPTYVRVTNLQNGKQIIVRVNDRGPFEKDRLIDLSYAAALKIGMMPKGTALVRVDAIDPTTPHAGKTKTIKPKKRPAIYLQIGAYGIRKNAIDMKKQAENATKQPVQLFKGIVNGKTIYRVKIGPIYDVKKADAITHQLETTGLNQTKAVVK